MDSKEVPIMGAIPSVIEHHVSVVLQNHVSIHVNRPEDGVHTRPAFFGSDLLHTAVALKTHQHVPWP